MLWSLIIEHVGVVDLDLDPMVYVIFTYSTKNHLMIADYASLNERAHVAEIQLQVDDVIHVDRF